MNSSTAVLCLDCSRDLPVGQRFDQEVLNVLRGTGPPMNVEQEILNATRARTRLRVELARAVSLQRELQCEIAATETYMARLRSVNTPFNRLPLELLDVIFAHVVNREADKCTFSYSLENATSTPTTLSHVCSRWRQRVMSSSELWTSICITEKPSAVTPAGYWERIGQAVLHHLIMSSTSLLKLRIGRGVSSQRILRPLFTQAHRWQECLTDNEAITSWMALITHVDHIKLGQLRLLKLPTVETWTPQMRLDRLRALEGCIDPKADFYLNWGQLTSLILSEEVTPQAVHVILQNCHILRRLEVCVSHRPDAAVDASISYPDVHHACLRRLFVVSTGAMSGETTIFARLTAPALASITFQGYSAAQAWEWDAKQTVALIACVRRSKARVQQLDLSFMRMEAADLERVLDGLPQLEKLVAVDNAPWVPLSRYLVTTLQPQGPNAVLRVPHLAELGIFGLTELGEEMRQDLYEVIKQRTIRRGGALTMLRLADTERAASEAQKFFTQVGELVPVYIDSISSSMTIVYTSATTLFPAL
ncbi:uncharacterized protein SCHCODRAFT_02591495 [Schizophyllum commune H4-8]|nr:uncharacterized protein SCHCODRAFT_02591495 [Schizophyllum commune H4-8]KAI5886357.1 hypothetical protein SCHCODRAFT_02591495 [Schizophyllum commune H4-8]